jgi:hypothetical protein
MARIGTRLHRFLFETERQIPEATGELSALLSQQKLDAPLYLGSRGDVERLEACVAAARAR